MTSIVRSATLILAALLASLPARAAAQTTSGEEPGSIAVASRSWVPARSSSAAPLKRAISLDLDSVTVRHAIAEIARRGGLPIGYDQEAARFKARVSLRGAGLTVGEALTAVLRGTGLEAYVSLTTGRVVVRAAPPAEAPAAVGAIVGKVSDGKTRSALAGATVVVQGTAHSATTGNDGRYRIAGVAPGTYTVRARYIGYAPGTTSVTVSADQEATADFALEKSAQRLDEVVTTGTVVPTEVKALPTPISVVTGEEIEQKGYQRIDQIFRGDIPGAIAWELNPTDFRTIMNIRGASSSAGSVFNVKTYVDGVEVADPYYLGTLEPSSIDRIEVLRGPEASTIYGSQALSGVMQIFTKKGTLGTVNPEVEAKISGGAIQSRWGSTAETDNTLAVHGGGASFSYRLGGGLTHYGDWVPGAHTTNGSLNAGLRTSQGPLTLELSASYYQRSFDDPSNPDFWALSPSFLPDDASDAVGHQTYGVNFTYAPTRHWQHHLVLGYDRNTFESYLNRPRFTTPADSLLAVNTTDESKASIAYNTSYAFDLGQDIHSSFTAGADYWIYHQGGFYAGSTTTNINTIVAPNIGYRYGYANTGYFAQAQLGLRDAVFLTTGLRAEDNRNFGQDFGLAWAPRIGLAYVRTLGNVTAKARVAFGKAIRPPLPGQASALVGPFSRQLANPNLGPEEQKGWDGGLDLSFGSLGSLEVTYFNQRAAGLIDNVTLDASTTPPAQQYQNVGAIKNRGWEFQGQFAVGRLSLAGTYTITNSIVQQLSPSYAGDLQPGDQMLLIPKHTAGATASYRLPLTAVTVGMTYIGPWVYYDELALFGYFYGDGAPFRGSFRNYWMTYPGFAKFNLSLTQTVTNQISVFLRADNLTNNNVSELSNFNLSAGRMTLIGVRAKL